MASKKFDFSSPGDPVLSPKKLAHVVLRTNNYHEMAKFYKEFLGATIIHQNEYICFLAYDEEHHRIALINVPGTSNKVSHTCGLEHIAFTYDTVAELALAYAQRKARGYKPIWWVNHGPTTSIYYSDPDGNQLETQVDNFDQVEEATAFMNSKLFQENPIGTEFDPDEIIQRLQAGESEEALKRRIDVGPRTMEDLPMARAEFYQVPL